MWDTSRFALSLNNRRAVRRRWRRTLSKDCYFRRSSARGMRPYLRICTWHRVTLVTRQVSVDRLVLLVPVRSPFEIESPLVRAQNQSRMEEKDETDPLGGDGGREILFPLALEGIYSESRFPVVILSRDRLTRTLSARFLIRDNAYCYLVFTRPPGTERDRFQESTNWNRLN